MTLRSCVHPSRKPLNHWIKCYFFIIEFKDLAFILNWQTVISRTKNWVRHFWLLIVKIVMRCFKIGIGFLNNCWKNNIAMRKISPFSLWLAKLLLPSLSVVEHLFISHCKIPMTGVSFFQITRFKLQHQRVTLRTCRELELKKC